MIPEVAIPPEWGAWGIVAAAFIATLGAVLLVLKQNRADIIAAHKAFIAATKDTAEAQHSFAEWLRNDAVTVGRANQAAAEALE